MTARDEAIPANVEALLIEQEHRWPIIVRNRLEYTAPASEDDPRPKAARLAWRWLLVRLIFLFFAGGTAVVGVTGGLVAAVFAYQANQLLSQQNQFVRAQTHLIEGQRRASYIFLASEALNQLAEEYRTWEDRRQPASTGSRAQSRSSYTADPLVVARLISISQVLTPYFSMDVGDREQAALASIARSPERGQLLLAIKDAPGSTLEDVCKAGAIFDHADLRGGTLGGPRIPTMTASLTGSPCPPDTSRSTNDGRDWKYRYTRLQMRDATLADSHVNNVGMYEADLTGTDWTNSTVQFCTIAYATLDRVRMGGSEAHLHGVIFMMSSFRDASFTDARIDNCCFAFVDCAGTKFLNTELSSTSFVRANLSNTSFTGASLTNVDFVHAFVSEDEVDARGWLESLPESVQVQWKLVQRTEGTSRWGPGWYLDRN